MDFPINTILRNFFLFNDQNKLIISNFIFSKRIIIIWQIKIKPNQ